MHSYRLLEDSELLSLVKDGNEQAFRFIYDNYWKKLYATARNRVSNEDDAEEIVQNIFCNFWRKRDALELVKGFDAYFYGALKFEVINCLARRTRVSQQQSDYAASYVDADYSMLHFLDYKETKNKLAKAIDALPEKCRMVFKLRHEQGYSLQQIAETLNISERTAEAHLFKARKTLRGAYELLLVICIISGYPHSN